MTKTCMKCSRKPTLIAQDNSSWEWRFCTQHMKSFLANSRNNAQATYLFPTADYVLHAHTKAEEKYLLPPVAREMVLRRSR